MRLGNLLSVSTPSGGGSMFMDMLRRRDEDRARGRVRDEPWNLVAMDTFERDVRATSLSIDFECVDVNWDNLRALADQPPSLRESFEQMQRNFLLGDESRAAEVRMSLLAAQQRAVSGLRRAAIEASASMQGLAESMRSISVMPSFATGVVRERANEYAEMHREERETRSQPPVLGNQPDMLIVEPLTEPPFERRHHNEASGVEAVRQERKRREYALAYNAGPATIRALGTTTRAGAASLAAAIARSRAGS